MEYSDFNFVMRHAPNKREEKPMPTVIRKKPKTLKAFCTSMKCCNDRYGLPERYALKNVSAGTTFCPDCKSALLWKRV